MNLIANASTVSTDSSQMILPRYDEAAGNVISVDTGLSVFIGIETTPFYRFITPEIVYPLPAQDRELLPFTETEINRLMNPDSMTNPVLADIWRDELNDEFVGS
jgi:hypothetical protein